MGLGLGKAVLAQFGSQVFTGHAVGLGEFVNADLIGQLKVGRGLALKQVESGISP